MDINSNSEQQSERKREGRGKLYTLMTW